MAGSRDGFLSTWRVEDENDRCSFDFGRAVDPLRRPVPPGVAKRLARALALLSLAVSAASAAPTVSAPATEVTRAAQRAVPQALLLRATQAGDDARRGFVGALADPVIRAADGRAIWDLIAQPVAVADLVDIVCAAFEGADRSVVTADILAFLGGLGRADLVHLGD